VGAVQGEGEGVTGTEKVIECFEKLREYADSEVHPVVSPDNWNIYSELRDLIDKAEKYTLALLKAQGPRVATWEEAQANVQDGPFIIFEVRDSTGSKVDFGVLVGDYYEMSENSVLTVADFGMLKDVYGKRFRLWTSRPTEGQRKAVEWE
jgi:hypothetical protein